VPEVYEGIGSKASAALLAAFFAGKR